MKAVGGLDQDQVINVHCQSEHPVRKQILYFAKLIDPQVSKENVKSVVKACKTCQLINLAPVGWTREKLSPKDNWNRLVTDITNTKR